MASKDTGCSTIDNIYKQESDPRYRYKLQKSQVGVLSFFLPNDKGDKFTARKHTRPVGRPHGKFYSPATDDHSPMRAGEWNFTPLNCDLDLGRWNLTLVRDIPSHYALSFCEVSLNLLQ